MLTWVLLLCLQNFSGIYASQCKASAFKNFIDLTHWITEKSPIWPNHVHFQMTLLPIVLGPVKGQSEKLVMSTHTGTHIDAPIHLGGKETLDQIPPENLYGPGVVIDVQNKTMVYQDYAVTKQDFLDFEAVHGKIPAGAVVLVNTGWESKYCSIKDYLGNDKDNVSALVYPALSGEGAEFLATERDIVGIGIDTVSFDTGNTTMYEAHVALLSRGKWGLEAVANLDLLPPTGFYVYVFPMKIAGASGAPSRVLAFIED